MVFSTPLSLAVGILFLSGTLHASPMPELQSRQSATCKSQAVVTVTNLLRQSDPQTVCAALLPVVAETVQIISGSTAVSSSGSAFEVVNLNIDDGSFSAVGPPAIGDPSDQAATDNSSGAGDETTTPDTTANNEGETNTDATNEGTSEDGSNSRLNSRQSEFPLALRQFSRDQIIQSCNCLYPVIRVQYNRVAAFPPNEGCTYADSYSTIQSYTNDASNDYSGPTTECQTRCTAQDYCRFFWIGRQEDTVYCLLSSGAYNSAETTCNGDGIEAIKGYNKGSRQ